jgi:hypothetical protein
LSMMVSMREAWIVEIVFRYLFSVLTPAILVRIALAAYSTEGNKVPLRISVFFILYYGVMLFERVTDHISYIHTINEHYHIYHGNITVGTNDPNIAYPHERWWWWWSVDVRITIGSRPLKSGLPLTRCRPYILINE